MAGRSRQDESENSSGAAEIADSSYFRIPSEAAGANRPCGMRQMM